MGVPFFPAAANAVVSVCCPRVWRFITPATPELKPLRYPYPRSARLRRRAEFDRVRTEGKTLHGRYLRLGRLSGPPDGETRVGIITTRRLGNAVTRNRVRRRLREIARLHLPEFTAICWLVVVAKPEAAAASFADLKDEWLRLARRLSILPARS